MHIAVTLRHSPSSLSHVGLSTTVRRLYTANDGDTALPYFKFLKERGNDVGRADFARLQRETLENYLIGLIRAVVCPVISQ